MKRTAGYALFVFTPDSKNIITDGGADPTVLVWDPTRINPVAVLKGHTTAISSIAVSSDGRLAASGSKDGTIKVWNLPERKEINTWVAYSEMEVSTLAFYPDGKTLVSGHGGHPATRVRCFNIWDVGTGKDLTSQKAGIRHLDRLRTVQCVRFSPDGKILAVLFAGAVGLFDPETGNYCGGLKGWGHRSSPVRSIAFSPDGRFFATGSDDQTIKLWDIPERK